MTDQSNEIRELTSRVQELEAENETLQDESAELQDQHETEVGGLLVEIALLEERVEQLEEERDVALIQVQEDFRCGSDEERVYLASKTRPIFHRPNCEWAKYIPTYKLIEFSSHAEAVEAGYKPCKTCRA